MAEPVPPRRVAGLPVVASIALPDDPPAATDVFVVITRDDARPLAAAYTVHCTYRNARDGSLVWESAPYGLPWDAALDLLISRVRHLSA